MRACTIEIPKTNWQMRHSTMGDWTPYEYKEIENCEAVKGGMPKKTGTFRNEWVSHAKYFPNEMQCLKYIIEEEAKTGSDPKTLADYLLALEVTTEYMTSKLLPFK